MAALLALQVIALLSHTLAANSYARAGLPHLETFDTSNFEKVLDSPTHPDIYSSFPIPIQAMRRSSPRWGYDNSKFTEALKERGFVVAGGAPKRLLLHLAFFGRQY